MTCSSEGDMGDIVYLCGILHGLGGRHNLLLEMSSKTKAKGEDGIANLCRLMIPFLESQQYIAEARRYVPGERVDWASAKFRSQGHYRIGESLMTAHLHNLISTLNIGHGINGDKKWITAMPDSRSHGRIVINRSGRYRNPNFPWLNIVSHYKHRLLFTGLKTEWREFCSHFGYTDYIETQDMLEVAQVIAASDLFIGNQSCAFALAEGLKKPRILEVSLEYPDCIFGGAEYIVDGGGRLPDVSGSGELVTNSTIANLDNLPVMLIPPRGWIFDSPETGHVFTSHIDTCARDVARKLKGRVTKEEARRMVLAYNVEVQPRHFAKYIQVPGYSRVKAALTAAGVTNHPIFQPAAARIKIAA